MEVFDAAAAVAAASWGHVRDFWPTLCLSLLCAHGRRKKKFAAAVGCGPVRDRKYGTHSGPTQELLYAIRFVFRRLRCIAERVSTFAIVTLLLLLVVVMVMVMVMGFAIKEETTQLQFSRVLVVAVAVASQHLLGQHRGGDGRWGVHGGREERKTFVCAKTQKLAP